MSTPPGLRTGLALVLATLEVAVAGCAHPVPPTGPLPPGTSLSPGQSAGSGRFPQGSEANASDEAPPDADGNPACPAYDSWRPDPRGAGITVTYWYVGIDPVTVLVRQQGSSDLSQAVDSNDASQRYHDFRFLDVNPTAVTDVIVTTATNTCYVRAVPS